MMVSTGTNDEVSLLLYITPTIKIGHGAKVSKLLA